LRYMPLHPMETPPLDPASESLELTPAALERLRETDLTEVIVTARGQLRYNGSIVGSLSKGGSLDAPRVTSFVEDSDLTTRLQAMVDQRVASFSRQLPTAGRGLAESERTLLRGLNEQLRGGLGSVRLAPIQGSIRAMRGSGRSVLDSTSIKIGRRYVYYPEGLTPQAVVARLALVTIQKGKQAPDLRKPPQVILLGPDSGLSHLSSKEFERIGYEVFTGRAVRIDIVERVLSPSFSQKPANVLPTLMHTFRCTEDEAKSFAKQLKIGTTTEKRGPRKKGGKDEGRTKNGRNRSGGRKSGFRNS